MYVYIIMIDKCTNDVLSCSVLYPAGSTFTTLFIIRAAYRYRNNIIMLLLLSSYPEEHYTNHHCHNII